jgi:hypothetical protein
MNTKTDAARDATTTTAASITGIHQIRLDLSRPP